jgi:glycosyltransferase involved in cell wall biosynthesis
MKLLVFAHTPPPHHGQSYMVQLMLAGFGGDCRKISRRGTPHSIQCYHVNARLSKHLEDIGDFRIGKLLLLFGYCLQAIWCRFRYGVTNFYYIPAPGKRSALYRDWLVMAVCRPFFKRVILHWHAAGLAKWLETNVHIRSRSVTFDLMKHADMSIVLSQYNRADAEKLFARRIEIVGNGVPDPCPAFEMDVLPRRNKRLAARNKLLDGELLTAEDVAGTGGDPHLFRVLFLAHCRRDKGLFDTLEGVALANEKLSCSQSAIRVHLTIAGQFISDRDRVEFEQRAAQADFSPTIAVPLPGRHDQKLSTKLVDYKGFVSGERKTRLFEESDCFCFPTYYYAESFGLVVIEAMAFGLPVITTRWRSIPELMLQHDASLVPSQDPRAIAAAILTKMSEASAQTLRNHFVRRFTFDECLTKLARAIRSVEQ